MIKTFFPLFDKAILALLSSVAFFTGCDVIKGGDQPVEYGTPTADFEIKGTVTDSLSSDPVPNIRVIRSNADYPQWGDTTYTDANGRYAFNFHDFPVEKPTFPLKAEDVDGNLNGGNYASKSVHVEISTSDWIQKGDGHWYFGKASKTQDFKIKK